MATGDHEESSAPGADTPERRLRLMADFAPVMLAHCDAEGRYRFVNRAYAARFGLRPEDVIGRRIPEIVGERAYAAFAGYVAEALAGRAVEFELEVPYDIGGTQHVRCAYAPEHAADGRVVGLVAAISNVTDRRRAEQEREELLVHVPVGIFRTDAAGQCLFVNERWSLLTGLSGQEAAGDGWRRAVHPEDRARVAAAWDEAMRRREEFRLEYRFRAPDGRVTWVAGSATPLFHEDGRVRGYLGSVNDIDERRRVQEEREHLLAAAERARAEAEAANRAKDHFLAMLGHELRNPLSAVRNAIATASLDPRRREPALVIARRQAEQLGSLVDDLLDVARITRGRIMLHRRRLVLQSVVTRAVDVSRPAIEAKAHALTLDAPREPIWVDADAVRLEQVIVNLLSNAAKYTDPGGSISVSVARDGGECAVRVRDSGVGIARGFLPHVFDLFTQGERDLDRAQGGLGIGLTVARQLVELHGGRIEAHSGGVDRGAEFVVRLAVVEPPEEASTRAAPADARGVTPATVLLVEDNPDAAESLRLLLEVMGHRVRIAADGLGALDAARTSRPDVMLVDIGLPGMDGYEVARRVRRDPELSATILIALTGYGQEEDRMKAFAAGFDRHLVKPVDPDHLGRVIAAVLGGATS